MNCPYQEHTRGDQQHRETKGKAIGWVNKVVVKHKANREDQISHHEPAADSAHLLPLFGVIGIRHDFTC
jgi:hypothetical protein